MKRNLQVIVMLMSIIIVIAVMMRLNNGSTYQEYVVGEVVYKDIMQSRTESTSLLKSVSFGEQELMLDVEKNIFYYSISNLSEDYFNPIVKVRGTENVKIAFLEQSITEEIIENNSTIDFLVYSETEYCRYGLKCTTLPLMNIEVENDEIGWEDANMSMILYDNQNGAPSDTIRSKGVIRYRGASTSVYPKKGYKITLLIDSLGENVRKNNLSLLGMRQDEEWILYAAYNDQEKIRNVFSTNLWNETCGTDNSLGINTGTEYKYLELFINGKYHGLYALGYTVDDKQLGIADNNMNAGLFKKINWSSERQLEFPGGYEIKNVSSHNEQYIDDSGWKILNEYYYMLAENYQDSEFLLQGIDKENAINFYLFMNLIQGMDNVSGSSTKNMYLSLYRKDGNIVGVYSPWDMDITWGNALEGTAKNNTQEYGIQADCNKPMESGYLNQIIINDDSNIIDDIVDKYYLLRADKWSETRIISMLKMYEEDIYGSGAYLRDMERWPDGTYSNEQVGLETFIDYVLRRFEESDAYIERLEAYAHESVYVRRSIQYNDFLKSSFIIEINNKELLKEDDYVDLLEYMGIDIDRISDDIRFILADPNEGMYEYREELFENDSVLKSCIGELSYGRLDTVSYPDESYYSVLLNGDRIYDISSNVVRDIRMAIWDGETVKFMDFSKDYYVSPRLVSYRDIGLYMYALEQTKYNVEWTINPKVWFDSQYVELFKKLNITGMQTDSNYIRYDYAMRTGYADSLIEITDEVEQTDDIIMQCRVYDNGQLIDSVQWVLVMEDKYTNPRAQIVSCQR